MKNNQWPLSIVIPTLNRPHYLAKALISIKNQSHLPSEIIIVDQSDGPETRQLFEAFDAGNIKKTYVHQSEKSLILARNRGIDLATESKFIGFLDDDLEIKSDFIEHLMARFASDTKGELAGGMGTFEGRNLKKKKFNEFFHMSHDGVGKFLPNGVPTYPHWMPDFAEVEFLSGGITIYRAEVIRSHKFDENLVGYGYGDDTDVSFRISRKFKLFIEPKAKCSHDDASTGRDPGFKHRKMWTQNMYYLLKKNVGVNKQSISSFRRLVAGQILDDLRHFRKGAFLGNFVAIKNILTGKLDSVRDSNLR